MFVKVLLLLFFVNSTAFGQTFITVDKDTYELVEDINFSLYNNKRVVYNGATRADEATTIKPDIIYDSIVFSRVDYETLSLMKAQIDSIIFLSKKTIYLDEIVIGDKKDKEIILGETNRFIKRRSRPLSKDLDYGLVLLNGSPEKLKLNKLMFYIDKVKLKTAYRAYFMEVSEVLHGEGHQHAEPGDVIYETDILYLNPKDKGKVEISLPDDLFLPAAKKMFVWIELIDYYNESGVVAEAKPDERTKLKFQLSKQLNYYSRLYDVHANMLSEFIININTWLNYDYVNTFFATPHKSSLVAPAIVLYAQKP